MRTNEPLESKIMIEEIKNPMGELKDENEKISWKVSKRNIRQEMKVKVNKKLGWDAQCSSKGCYRSN